MGVVIGVVVFLVICVGIGLWFAPKYEASKREASQRERERQIEAEMRQDIIDQQSRKKIADKILREAGERP
jgi:septal ring-binding cell division protein DamX